MLFWKKIETNRMQFLYVLYASFALTNSTISCQALIRDFRLKKIFAFHAMVNIVPSLTIFLEQTLP